MLCSRCSEVIRPVVAVDIDGVLGDYHGHFIKFLEEYLDWRENVPFHSRSGMYDGSVQMSTWAMRRYQISYRDWQDIKLAYRQGAQKRSMPVYPCAKELLERLELAGAEVWLTTTRPYMRLDNIDPDTRFWLERHELPYHYMLYDERKYRELHDRVGDRVVGVLDDEVEQLDWAAKLWGDDIPIMRKTPWNNASPATYPAASLLAAGAILLERVDQFKANAVMESIGER
jgi:hypothetical protein